MTALCAFRFEGFYLNVVGCKAFPFARGFFMPGLFYLNVVGCKVIHKLVNEIRDVCKFYLNVVGCKADENDSCDGCNHSVLSERSGM